MSEVTRAVGGLLRELPGLLFLVAIRLLPLSVGTWLLYAHSENKLLLGLGLVACLVGIVWAAPLLALIPGLSRFGVHVQTANWAGKNYTFLLLASQNEPRTDHANLHESILRSLAQSRYGTDPNNPQLSRILEGVSKETGVFGLVLRILGEEAQLFENDLSRYIALSEQIQAALQRFDLPPHVLWGEEAGGSAGAFAIELCLRKRRR